MSEKNSSETFSESNTTPSTTKIMKDHTDTDIDLFSPEQVRVSATLDRVGPKVVKNLITNILNSMREAQDVMSRIPRNFFQRAIFEFDAIARASGSLVDRYEADEMLEWYKFIEARVLVANEHAKNPEFMAEMNKELDKAGPLGEMLRQILKESFEEQSEA